MTRAERNEFNYIRHSLRTIGRNPYGAQLTIRTDAGREYKQTLHALYTSLGFHPASVGIDTRRFDGKERIVYIPLDRALHQRGKRPLRRGFTVRRGQP